MLECKYDFLGKFLPQLMIRVMEADIELLYLAMRASAINECMNA